jgi:hypothetical protein
MWKRIVACLKWFFKQITYRQRLEDKIDGIINTQSDIERRVLRLEILQAMKRKDKYTVYALYDEYKKYNGNSYMDELFNKYKKSKK